MFHCDSRLLRGGFVPKRLQTFYFKDSSGALRRRNTDTHGGGSRAIGMLEDVQDRSFVGKWLRTRLAFINVLEDRARPYF